MLVAGDDKIIVGTPTVEGAKVLATSQGGGKDKKIIVFHYKAKVRHRKKTGHRRQFTRLAIDSIVEPGNSPAEPARKTRRTRKEDTPE